VATTAEDLIVNIKAKLDQAKRDTAAYQKQLDTLEEGATVPVKVKGGRDLDDLFAKVDRLSTEDASIVVGIEMAKAQRDIKDLLYDISRLDSEDATVDVKVEQLAQARGDLEAMEAKVKALNDLPLEPGRGGDPGAGMRKIVDGADQANSAVSNMVGNASQDLGELTGVSGSAGVALGQLAEYFSDTAFAAKAAGQSMGAAFKSFALASLPIAGISIVVGLLTSIAAKAGEMGRKINEASKLAVSSMLDVAEAGGRLGEGLDDVAESAVTKIFEELGSKTPKVVDALRRMGITWDEVTEGFRSGEGDLADALTMWDRFQAGVALYGTRQAKADFREQMGFTEEQADEVLADLEAVDAAFGTSFDVQTKANEAGRAAGEYRSEAADSTEAAAEAEAKLAEETAKGTEEAEKQRAAAEELAAAMDEWAVKTTQAEGALAELAGTFTQMSTRGDALSALFDLGNAPLDAAASVRDITIAIDDLSEKAKGISGKDIKLGTVKADELLDSIDSLRPQIQGKVVEAFSAGGPEAATAMANSYVDRVTAELGGKLTRDEVAKLLGLDNIEATVAVAIEMSDIENAKRQLAILTGLKGETPYTASIALALDAGTITGAQAQTLVQAQLGDAGVEIPAELAKPNTPQAVREADAALRAGKPVTMPTEADTSGAEGDVAGFKRETERDTVTAPVDADTGDAEGEAEDFRRRTRNTRPVVPVDSDTANALYTMRLLMFLAALIQPTVHVEADTAGAAAEIRGLGNMRPRVPVDAYLADYPSAGEIQRAIGRPRIPVDIVVGSSIRITGVRE
jgi:hypothetical protein